MNPDPTIQYRFVMIERNLIIIVLLLALNWANASIMHDTITWQALETENQFSIPSITDIDYDKHGNVWMSTFDGIVKFDGYRFKKYKVVEEENMGLVKPKILSIHRDSKGDIWFAGEFSIYRYSEKYDDLERMTESLRNDFDALYTISFFDIEDLDDQHKLLATKQGAWVYHVPSKQTVKYLSVVDSIELDKYSTNAHIFKMAQDEDDPEYVWLLTKSSLAKLNKKSLEVHHYPIPKIMKNKRYGDRGQSIVVTKDKVFVLLNFLHLYEYDKATERWSALPLVKYKGRERHVRNLLPYKEGFIITYIKHNLQYHNAITGERTDMYEIHPSKELDYGHSHLAYDHLGYLTYIYNNQSLYRSDRNNRSARITQKILTSNLLVEGVSRPDSVQANEVIELPSYQRNVSFDIGLSNRSNNDVEQYFYSINNAKWIPVEDRTIQLDKLGDGAYDIRAKITSNGKEYVATAKRIYVEPFFYETWWFVTLIALSLLGIFSTLLHLYSLRRKEQAKFKQQLLNLEMNALRSQMNPHFLFNSLNSIKNFVVSKSRDEAADYLTSFSKLMRMILENSRKKFMTLEDELKMIKLYIEMECTRLNRSFDYEINVDPDIDSEFLLPPMLLQPYVENAIWHGLMSKYGDKKLTLNVIPSETGITCILRDNGIGRKASIKAKGGVVNSKKSLGMKITGDRFKIFNELYGINTSCQINDLYDDKEQAIGTEVIISLPKIDDRVHELL